MARADEFESQKLVGTFEPQAEVLQGSSVNHALIRI